MDPHRRHDSDQLWQQGVEDLRSGNYRSALEKLSRAVALAPDRLDIWQEILKTLQLLGDDRSAEQTLAQALDLGLSDKEIWYELAHTLHGQAAQRAYRQVLSIDPQFEPALCELAWSLRSTGDKEEALKIYRQLLAKYTEQRDVHALNRLGDTLRRLVGAIDEAEEAFNCALDIDPDNFTTWKNLCYSMCSRRDAARAQQIIRRFIQTYPEHPQRAAAWVCLATVLTSIDDLNGAEQAARAALEIDCDCQPAWSKLADILFELGRPTEAQVALARANDLDYNKRFDDDPVV